MGEIRTSNVPPSSLPTHLIGINDLGGGILQTCKVTRADLISGLTADFTEIVDTRIGTLTGLIDDTNNQIRVGANVLPDPLIGTDSLLTGQGNIAIGFDVMTRADARHAVSIAIGSATMESAKDAYGATMIGFRTGGQMGQVGDCFYTTGVGIDCFSFSKEVSNATAIGAHCATYKDSVKTSFIAGAFTGFGAGSVTSSVIIGYSAAAGEIVSPLSDYSFDNCVIIGAETGVFNAASDNVFIGRGAANGTRITGGNNTAVGSQAMGSISSGSNNTSTGALSGRYIAGGTQNAFVGYLSGGSITSGSNNTAIGYAAGPNADVSNTTSLGANAVCTASNQITLGDASVSSLRCQVTSITSLSDMHDKVRAGADGRLPFNALDFVRGVTVRWFTWDARDGSKKTSLPEAGIFAQELDALQVRFGVDLGLVDKQNPNRLEATPGKLLFPLIEATQGLSVKVDDNERRIVALETELAELRAAA